MARWILFTKLLVKLRQRKPYFEINLFLVKFGQNKYKDKEGERPFNKRVP